MLEKKVPSSSRSGLSRSRRLLPLLVLTLIATGQTPSDIPPFIRSWYRDYDYLYVLGPPVVNPLPNLLDELDRSARFVLYKIRRTP